MNLQKKLHVPNQITGYDYVSDVNEISKPLFDRYAINFFDHARIFYDGTWIFFTSSADVTRNLIESGFSYLPYVNIPYQQSFHLLSTTEKFLPYLSIIRENFKVDNLLAYMEKQDRYIDVFWFGSPAENTSILNFYFNNLDLLKNYVYHFKDKAQPIIKNSETKRITIPPALQSDYNHAFDHIKELKKKNSSTELLKKLSVKINLNGLDVCITYRELECIQLTAKGFTAKMIAKELGLSPRTIETYLENIKIKLKLKSKNELIQFLAGSSF